LAKLLFFDQLSRGVHAKNENTSTEGRRQNLLGEEIYKMMSAKILWKILILTWLSLAFGLSQSDKVLFKMQVL
jgi:hypothetical protein